MERSEKLNSYLVIFLVLILLGETWAQIPFFGFCPSPKAMRSFDAKKYAGKWYEIEKYFTISELGGTCNTATYSDNGDGTLGVVTSQIQAMTRTEKTAKGTGRLRVNDGSAHFGVLFPASTFPMETNYMVLDSDYEKFAIVWSCTGLGLINFQTLWVLSRERQPSQELRKKVYEKIDSFKMPFKSSMLQKTDQSDCSNSR